MEPQTPAVGILKTHDFGDSKFYHIPCECGNDDDSLQLEVAADECGITIRQYSKIKTRWWGENVLMNRLKLIWLILFCGYIDMESYTVLSEQAALNYAETIKKAIKDVECFKESQKKYVREGIVS